MAWYSCHQVFHILYFDILKASFTLITRLLSSWNSPNGMPGDCRENNIIFHSIYPVFRKPGIKREELLGEKFTLLPGAQQLSAKGQYVKNSCSLATRRSEKSRYLPGASRLCQNSAGKCTVATRHSELDLAFLVVRSIYITSRI